MSKIEIFEAAGCCATSSVVVSDEAVKWNASAEWAKKHGVNIQRYSLAKNPQQFLNTPVIRAFLNTSGMESAAALLQHSPYALIPEELNNDDAIFTEYPPVYLLHRQRRRGENLSGLRDGGMAG